MKRSIKRTSLIMNVIAIIIASALLIGSTFAWFTDTATSSGNKIQSGTLKVDLELLGEDGTWTSIKESNAPIFDYDKWEPGYTDVKILKVENEGSLALQWKARLVTENDLSELADVIDVYVLPSETEIAYPLNRDLDGYTKVGTVREFANTLEDTTRGELAAEEVAYLGLALKMQNVGNRYQGLDLCGEFDIQILATQLTAEEDGFDDQYDSGATLDFTPVSTNDELRTALENGDENIVLFDNIVVESDYIVDSDAIIDGNGFDIVRKSEDTVSTFSTRAAVHTGSVFVVKNGTTLELTNIVIDGGAVWTGEVDSVLERGTVNSGITSTGALITTEGNGSVVLGEGAVVQNCDGASVINLATRGNGVLTIDGGKIINNNGGGAGAIWGGGAIVMNSGKISGNYGGIGGVVRTVDSQGKYNISFTLNGGEISHNSAGTGGVIWSGNNLKVYFNGGEIAYNYATTAGGVIWGGSADKYYITGDVKIHDNAAGELGNAFRFNHYLYPYLEMTGGHIYNNDAKGIDAIYAINDTVSLTGGVIDDNILYTGGVGLTMGMVQMNGVVKYDLSTNHNTAYLAKEFNAFKFTVNESAANFAQFNFKPAGDYVYTEGDEAKLICMLEGYSTYWDESTSTFRLQAEVVD